MWIGSSLAVPSGWLICDGSAISRIGYAPLFTAMGTIFGPGDGVTTFNLPDFRDRVPMGAKFDIAGLPITTVTGGSTTFGGATSHTLSVAELPAHHHNMSHTHSADTKSGGGGSLTTVKVDTDTSTTTGGATVSLPNVTDTADTGGGSGFSTLDPYFAIYYVIYTGT